MAKFRREGKVRYLGLSKISSETLRRACKAVHIDAVQIGHSPFTIDTEDPKIGLRKTRRELGVAVVAYSPTSHQMTSSDFRRMSSRFSKENFPKNQKLVDGISAFAKKKGCTAGQLLVDGSGR